MRGSGYGPVSGLGFRPASCVAVRLRRIIVITNLECFDPSASQEAGGKKHGFARKSRYVCFSLSSSHESRRIPKKASSSSFSSPSVMDISLPSATCSINHPIYRVCSPLHFPSTLPSSRPVSSCYPALSPAVTLHHYLPLIFSRLPPLPPFFHSSVLSSDDASFSSASVWKFFFLFSLSPPSLPPSFCSTRLG